MKRLAAVAVLAILSSHPATEAVAITDPHVENGPMATCLLCHLKEIGPEAAGHWEYDLVEDTIDAVCLRCHSKTECCVIGQKHSAGPAIGRSHPSDLDARDVKPESLPKTLPLQDGKITCNTCHFHRRQGGRDYKLVRIVAFKDSAVDWAGLCRDCHKDL